MVKRATATSSYVGNGVYNMTGTGQTQSWSSRRGYDRSFYLRFENDGNVADSFGLKGCGASTGFSVRYQGGGRDVTSAVTAGSYTTSTLQPGGAARITLVLHVKRAATIGAVKRCLVSATSVTRSTKADTIRATLKVLAR